MIRLPLLFIPVSFFMLCLAHACKTPAPAPEVQASSADSLCVEAKDRYYQQAYQEILDMLEGRSGPSFKRAVFLGEWAYLQGKLDYEAYCAEIARIGSNLKRFVKQKGVEQYRTSGNYALFEFFTQSNWMNGYKPFTYDFEDFAGRADLTKLFVTKAMKTHTGQCRSLPMLYKVLAEEIGAQAYLAQAPSHMFVKHLDEENHWVNIELTNGGIVSDAHLISTSGISVEAIRNGIYLSEMDDRQCLAFLLYEVSLGYARLHGYDDFILQCCDRSLAYYPNNITALMTKHNCLVDMGLKYLAANGNIIDEGAEELYYRRIAVTQQIEQMGFRDMPEELYLEWVKAVEEEKAKQKQAQKNTNEQ